MGFNSEFKGLSMRMEPDSQLKETVNLWLVPELKTFYSEGMNKLRDEGPRASKERGLR